MAITRTQIARQLYKNGRRVGLFAGAQADASAGKGSMSPGTSGTGGTRGGNTGTGRDLDFQQRGMSKKDYDAIKGDRDQNFGGRKDDLNIAEKVRLNALKNLYDEKFGLKKTMPSFLSSFSLFNPALKDYKKSDPEFDDYGMTGDDLTDTDRLADAINKAEKTGNITQGEFTGAFFGPDGPPGPPEGGEGALQDPCRGPNPPAYCFTGLRSASAATPEVEEDDEIINYRLMNKGGRVNLFKGAQADASAGKGAMSPGTSGLGGSQAGGYGRDQENRGDRTKDDPRDVDKDNPTFSIFNPIDFVKTKLNTFAGLTPVDLEKVKNIENEDDDEDVNYPTGGSFLDPNLNEKKQAEIFQEFKADGGRIGLMGGGMPYEGGIMDLESSRQMYGLGKLVKKVTRSVKKIAKSPIGKAAILAAGGYALGGGFAAGGGFKKATLLSRLGLGSFDGYQRSFTKNALGKFLTNKATLGIGIPAIASYFMTPEEEKEKKLYAGADIDDVDTIINNPRDYINPRLMAEGGSTEEKEPVAKKVMPLLDMEGQEKDYRETGGFVDMGRMEKADDVPARLSKNEFVFTADAVRNAGDGSVDKGAEVMYNMMKNLESGGDVSEESQGLEGARDMFKTSQRLEEVL